MNKHDIQAICDAYDAGYKDGIDAHIRKNQHETFGKRDAYLYGRSKGLNIRAEREALRKR